MNKEDYLGRCFIHPTLCKLYRIKEVFEPIENHGDTIGVEYEIIEVPAKGSPKMYTTNGYFPFCDGLIEVEPYIFSPCQTLVFAIQEYRTLLFDLINTRAHNPEKFIPMLKDYVKSKSKK